MPFDLYIPNIEYGLINIWFFKYLFILTFNILFLFILDRSKKKKYIFMFWFPKDKIMVLFYFMRIQKVNGYLLSLFGCLKINVSFVSK